MGSRHLSLAMATSSHAHCIPAGQSHVDLGSGLARSAACRLSRGACAVGRDWGEGLVQPSPTALLPRRPPCLLQHGPGRLPERGGFICPVPEGARHHPWAARHRQDHDRGRSHSAGCETRPKGGQGVRLPAGPVDRECGPLWAGGQGVRPPLGWWVLSLSRVTGKVPATVLGVDWDILERGVWSAGLDRVLPHSPTRRHRHGRACRQLGWAPGFTCSPVAPCFVNLTFHCREGACVLIHAGLSQS